MDSICSDGLGRDLLIEAGLNEQAEVRLGSLLEFLKAQTHGFDIL